METKGLCPLLGAPNPPEGLVQGILQRIKREELFRLRRNAALVSTCVGVFFFALIESIRMTAIQLSQSGFIQFSSSLLSDTDALIAGGTSSIFALLESFPFFYASVTLGIVLTLGIIVPIFWRDIRILKNFAFIHSTHL